MAARRRLPTLATAEGEDRWHLPVLTVQEVLSLPASMEMVYAARALSIGRTAAYTQARAGKCLMYGDERVPVQRVGTTWRVKRSDLLRVLGISDPAQATASESVA